MYRPTVRYSDVYKNYVDALFQTTHLDRNQIIRAALFAAAHSKEFQALMLQNKKSDAPLPYPTWSLDQAELWQEKSPKLDGGGKDVQEQNSNTEIEEKKIPMRKSGGKVKIEIKKRSLQHI